MASGQGSAAGNQSPPGGIASIIGSRVYVPDGVHVWLPATVTKVLGAFKFEVHVEQCKSAAEIEPCSDGITAVVDVAGPQFGGTFCLPLQNEETSDGGVVGDICSLRHIHEAAVLDTLRRRFEAKLPYSYAGKVCIAVNPYERPDIYGEDTQRTYETASKRAELPPHVYATSAQALKMAKAFGADQSILVTGESGAGKTKTVKFLAHYLVGTTADCSLNMKRKVFLSTFLLESFGNANTPRNNNSSRFAKLMRLRIDQHGQLSGIEVNFFLLEDNRVVWRPSGERNFHVLYQLLAAPASFKNPLHLEGKSSDFFRYTDRGTDQRGAMDLNVDARSFGLTIHALKNSLVTDEKILALFSLLSGVLHLGQVDFHDGTSEADRAVWYSDANDLSVSAEMFGVPRQELGEYLTHETRILATSAANVPLSPAAAHSRANSLAKEIYSRIFGWLVRTINNTTGDTSGGRKVTINLLDTFGYENNKHNGFEQLCINYIDEKLQQFFVQDVFNALQTEHYIEGVSRMYVDFQDNAAILAMIEDPPSANFVDPKQRRGLLHVLADHCRQPRGKGETFISEVLETFRQDANFEAGPFATGRHFAVRHSIGTVTYDAENFVEKNRVRKMADKGVRLLAASKNELLRELFRNEVDGVMQHPDGSLRHQETLGCKLRRKLHAVKCAIERTDVQYVRCINPNSSQSKDDFDAHKVVEQLRAGGITEMAQVMQSVYSISMEDAMFLQHYAGIADFGAGHPGGARRSPSSQCSLILEQDLGSEKRDRAFFVGPNKVFLADGIFEKLEHRRRKALMAKSAISHRFSKLHEKCLRLPIATYLLIWRDIGRFVSLHAAMDPSKSNLRQKVLRFAAAGQYVVRCVDYCTARNIVPPAEVLGNLEDKVFKLCDFARNTARGIEPWRQLQDEQTRQKWPQSQEEKEDLLRHLTLFLAEPQQRGRNESGPNNITRRLASEKSISNEIPPHGDDGDFRERGGDCNTDHGTSQMRHVSKLDSGVPGNSNSLSPRTSGGKDTADIDKIPRVVLKACPLPGKLEKRVEGLGNHRSWEVVLICGYSSKTLGIFSSKTLGQQALSRAKRELQSGGLSGGGAESVEGKQAGKQGGEIKKAMAGRSMIEQ